MIFDALGDGGNERCVSEQKSGFGDGSNERRMVEQARCFGGGFALLQEVTQDAVDLLVHRRRIRQCGLFIEEGQYLTI
jgi:hypothetical protein